MRTSDTPVLFGPDDRPLTSAQRGIWFAHRIDPTCSVDVMGYRLEIRGAVDADRLRAAIGAAAAEDDAARLRFTEVDGVPVQHVGPARDLTPPLVDLSEDADPAGALAALVRADLDRAPDFADLVRHTLFRLGARHHVWYTRAHHLVHDGHTEILLWRRAAQCYAGTGEPLGGFAAVLDEEAAYLGSDDHRRDKEFWQSYLDGVEPRRPRYRPANRVVRESVHVDEEGLDRLRAVAAGMGVTWKQVVVAAAVVHQHLTTGDPDVLIGLPMACRVTEAARTAPAMLAAVQPLRVRLDPGEPVAALIARVAAEVTRIKAHQRHDPAELRRPSGGPGDGRGGFGPVVNILAADEPIAFGAARAAGGRMVAGGAAEDPAFTVTRFAPGEGLWIEHCVDAAHPDVDSRARLRSFLRVLDAVTEEPGGPVRGIGLLSPAEAADLTGRWTAADVPDLTLPALFDRAAAAHPDRVALVSGDERLTYRELGARADRLAGALAAAGVRRGDLVGVLVERGTAFAVAVLAVVKAGAGYSVLDPAFPDDRLALVVAESGVRVVVAAPELAGRVTAPTVAPDAEGEPPVVAVAPDDVACVMFTSGSTGRPKGVVSPHRALVGTLLGQGYADFGPDEVFLQCSPVSWDAFSLEFWGALGFGGTCVLQPGQRPEPALIARLVAEHGVTMLQLSSSLFNYLVDELPEAFTGVRLAFTGGEAASAAHIASLLTRHPGIRVANGYGPAESLGYTTAHRVTSAPEGGVPIGTPVVNKRAYVLDSRLMPVPAGVVGEVYLGGVGLARGYAGKPDGTAERFVADPYGPPGERMYRTGDLARWSAAGELEFAGRADEQVKVRGFRVEPAEVEAALVGHPEVSRAAVVVWRDGPPRLIAYVVGEVDGLQLRAWSAERLPEHLVPSVVTVLDALPITANGKLDRRALPAPDVAAPTGGRAPADAREEILCGLFAEVLGVDRVGPDDGFFDLGGHSLLAARLAARVRDALGTEPSIGDVFAAPTPAALALRVGAARPGRPPLTRADRPPTVPLSPNQRRLWFLDRHGEAGAAYTVPLAIGIDGPLDADALAQAVADLAARHEVLRTVFPVVHDDPVQHVLPAAPPMARAEHTADAVRAAATHRFDLAVEPPMRVTLLGAGERHLLLILLHHIATDGHSLRPLLTDLAEAYAARRDGREPAWRPLPVQYADYTLWQRDLPDDLDHWTTALAGLPEDVPLPLDRPRPASCGHRGGTVAVPYDPDRLARVRALARAERCTPFMVLHAALAATLTRLGAGTDIPIGTPVAGRPDAALADLVGFFANTVVLRADTSGTPSFRTLLSRVRATDLAAYDHQGTPFDRVLEALNPRRTLDRHPLFQVCLAVEGPTDRLVLPGARTTVPEVLDRGTAKFDLEFLLDQRDDALGGTVVYNAEVFDQGTADRITAALLRLLDAALADPDRPVAEIDVLADEERATLLRWAGTTSAVQDPSLVDLVERAVAEAPDAVALLGPRPMTYAELAARAHRLARALLAAGVARGDVVGVLAPRGAEFAVAVLAVVTAGAAYTLLDPDFPDQRLAAVVEDIGIRHVVADPASAARLSGVRVVPVGAGADLSADPLGVGVSADDAACVMFTSGSTGRPKGVVAPHRALVGTLLGQDYADFGPGQVFLQCSPVSWDAFSLEFWGALGFGGACVLQPGQRPEPEEIARLVAEHGVTMLQLSSTLFNHLVDELPEAFAGVRVAFTGGEAASAAHVHRIRGRFPDLRVTNGYGPAESLGFTTTHPVGAEGTVPIGRPLANKRAYVLDHRLGLAPIGVVGEVYLGGAGLARGYAGKPGLSAERFVADPYGAAGERVYRTGDLARWTADGVLEFAGRADDQVKIRGFRVEPGEVEAVLLGHPDLAQAAVVAWRAENEPARLVAYVVACGPLSPPRLRAWVADRLPEHMVPAAVVTLDALPITANGKLDRRSLPAPEFAAAAEGRAPRDDRERALCALFEEILGVAGIGIDDAFFDLGGHSLLAARLVSRARGALGAELTVRDVFQAPTVAALAARTLVTARPRRPALQRRTRDGALL